ncbi:hypothetical protein FIBSPDRAFT_886903 [Athelia psychrophila]|uniref:Retrotransposon Copia-like N-terminal domain-containing protein n=1 Tax=Athelia psychrophila TaxID=1759441 RepID=A0A166QCZ1_9AGAM|nr:hypothetical protein FIBSPDRAFT_886903 [Fibularhizoctonia sp. CBS 109695]
MPSPILLENVVKLNGENWSSWSSQITKVLITVEADEIVTGNERQPMDEAESKAWTKANKRAWLSTTQIQSVLKARTQLISIGVEIDDITAKDIILMNLNPSYQAVKTLLFTQANEPTIETIHAILTSSCHIITPDIMAPVKSEPSKTTLAAKFQRRNDTTRQ